MGLLVKLQAMQQLTILINKSKEYSHRSSYRYRASLIFYYSSIVLIIYVIICRVVFKLDCQALFPFLNFLNLALSDRLEHTMTKF